MRYSYARLHLTANIQIVILESFHRDSRYDCHHSYFTLEIFDRALEPNCTTSLGACPSDFVTVVALARKAHRASTDSSFDYRALCAEVASLHNELQETEEHLSGDDSSTSQTSRLEDQEISDILFSKMSNVFWMNTKLLEDIVSISRPL